LSPWGYLLLTGWAALMAILTKGPWLVGLVLVELALGLAWNRKGLEPLCQIRFWALVLGIVALGPFLLGEPDTTVGPYHLSKEGLVTGAEMASRASALALAFSLGIGSLSLFDVVAVFDRIGLRGLGFATALAMNLLGTLRDMATVTLQTIYLRGGMRRPGKALRLFSISTVANTLRYGDEAVNAASVRAFDPNHGRPSPLPLRWADLGLAALMAGYTGAILLLGAG
jgi:energy-coupling factor transporter transmembrane protein EcfT